MASATEATLTILNVVNPPEVRENARTAAPLSLRRNAFWTTLGNGAFAAGQWAQIALIAHLGTSAEVGHYALALAVCSPVFLLFNLQLRPIQATDSERAYSFAEYLGLRVVSSVLALGVVCILTCFLSHSTSAIALTLMVGVFKAIDSTSDIYQGLLQQHERMDYVGRSLLLRSGFMLFGFGCTYYVTRSLVWALGALICAQCAGFLLYDIRASYLATGGRSGDSWISVIRAMAQISFERVRLTRLAIRAMPLGIAMMLLSLYTNLPRFVLNKYVGAAGVGVFAAITYISMIGGLLVTAIGTAVAPRLSQYAYTNRRAYRQLLGKLVLFAAILGIAGIAGCLAFGRPLLGFLYGPEYARRTDVLGWAMLAAAFSYLSSSFGFGATTLGRFKGQPWIVGIATVVLLVAALLLVPRFGLTGAAMATVISTFTSLIGYMTLVLYRRYDNF